MEWTQMAIAQPPALRSSAGTSSGPTALPVPARAMAEATAVGEGRKRWIGTARTGSVEERAGWGSEAPAKSSTKCSSHRAAAWAESCASV
eukprot:10715344-Heterocapsa_arctica.AAC.1